MNKWLFSSFTALCLLFSFASECFPNQNTNAQASSEKKPATTLQDYVGRFEADQNMVENFILDVFMDKNELWIKASHAPKRKLVAKSTDSFVISDPEATIKFNRDAKGVVAGLTVEGPTRPNHKPLTARKLVLPPPSLKGNTTFRLKGYPNARLVALAGTFNEFNQSQLFFAKEGDEWVVRIDLAPGKYTYKFIIDGDWILDPENPNTEDDERGFTNSVLVVKAK